MANHSSLTQSVMGSQTAGKLRTLRGFYYLLSKNATTKKSMASKSSRLLPIAITFSLLVIGFMTWAPWFIPPGVLRKHKRVVRSAFTHMKWDASDGLKGGSDLETDYAEGDKSSVQ
jgi:hypothetical protein